MSEKKRVTFGEIPLVTIEKMEKLKKRWYENTYTKVLIRAFNELDQVEKTCKEWEEKYMNLERVHESVKDDLNLLSRAEIAKKRLLNKAE